MIKLAPSLLAADLLNLERDIARMERDGIELLHFDIMDAHFVPNLSFGPALCEAVHRRFPNCHLDVHLMMDNPVDYIDRFADAGAHTLTLHLEALDDPAAALNKIKARSVRRGLSIRPGTDVRLLLPYLENLEHILIMTVEPGFGGQKLMPEQLDKIRFLRAQGFRGDIAADGGVNMKNAALLAEAGASVLVMGTAYFHAENSAQVVQAVKELSK